MMRYDTISFVAIHDDPTQDNAIQICTSWYLLNGPTHDEWQRQKSVKNCSGVAKCLNVGIGDQSHDNHL